MFSFSHISGIFLARCCTVLPRDCTSSAAGMTFFLLHAMLLPIRSHGSVISKYNDVTQTQLDGDAQCCRPRTRLWTRCIEWYWPTSHYASGQPQCSIHCQASQVLWMRPAIFTMLRSENIRRLWAHCPGSQAVEDLPPGSRIFSSILKYPRDFVDLFFFFFYCVFVLQASQITTQTVFIALFLLL